MPATPTDIDPGAAAAAARVRGAWQGQGHRELLSQEVAVSPGRSRGYCPESPAQSWLGLLEEQVQDCSSTGVADQVCLRRRGAAVECGARSPRRFELAHVGRCPGNIIITKEKPPRREVPRRVACQCGPIRSRKHWIPSGYRSIRSRISWIPS